MNADHSCSAYWLRGFEMHVSIWSMLKANLSRLIPNHDASAVRRNGLAELSYV